MDVAWRLAQASVWRWDVAWRSPLAVVWAWTSGQASALQLDVV
jgi:hypothetical protein